MACTLQWATTNAAALGLAALLHAAFDAALQGSQRCIAACAMHRASDRCTQRSMRDARRSMRAAIDAQRATIDAMHRCMHARKIASMHA
ncbi:MAG: hypothetical protein INH34_10560 [Phycisphaerales bacterium]|nr:hypothetical protein [Phycisphaerales bacterium]